MKSIKLTISKTYCTIRNVVNQIDYRFYQRIRFKKQKKLWGLEPFLVNIKVSNWRKRT